MSASSTYVLMLQQGREWLGISRGAGKFVHVFVFLFSIQKIAGVATTVENFLSGIGDGAFRAALVLEEQAGVHSFDASGQCAGRSAVDEDGLPGSIQQRPELG